MDGFLCFARSEGIGGRGRGVTEKEDLEISIKGKECRRGKFFLGGILPGQLM